MTMYGDKALESSVVRPYMDYKQRLIDMSKQGEDRLIRDKTQ